MSDYRVWDGYSLTYQDTPTEEFACMHAAGIHDIKNTLLYEGDIVTDERGKGIVEYDEFDCRFFLRVGAETRDIRGAFTIVGNAFEDPNLL